MAYDDNGNQVTDASKLAELIIKWTEQFAKQYGIDSNVISAQQYEESKFRAWNYSQSGAIGFTQFTVTTIVDWIFIRGPLSETEKDTLSAGVVGDRTKTNTFLVSSKKNEDYNSIRRANKTVLFQNVVNNPKIMIHAQASLMQFIGNRNGNIASSSLFAYNRGSGLSSATYVDAISTVVNGRKSATGKILYPKQGKEYSFEGLKYVDRIFSVLNSGYGYKLDLTINDVATKEVYTRTKSG
ncbi:MAG: hypothetical protein HC836_36370 [Richelia sp. RM2_1_2]|nr:hypothetical protein [Richelia sp. RM2_1_2]